MSDAKDISDLLGSIPAPQNVSQTPDIETVEEEEDLEKQQKKAIILGLTQDIEERKTYASRAFWLVVVWLVFIGIVIILQGFNLWSFTLTPAVLVTLIGSTTSGVVGIFLIVTRYLFYHDSGIQSK